MLDTSAARVLGDTDALERLVANLLDKAVCHARHSADVALTVDSTLTADDL